MPATYIKTAGTHEVLLQPYVKTAGTWEPVLNIWVKSAGTWELAFTGFTATASPSALDDIGASATVVSGSATASTVGGVGPFTYLWSQVSGGSINPTSTTSVSTTFRALAMGIGESRNAVFKCTVTDTSTSLSEDTNTVEVTLTRA